MGLKRTGYLISEIARLFLGFLYILRYIPQFTMKDFTELIKRIGIDIFIFAQPVKLSGADTIVLDKFILGNAPFLHRCPQAVKYNHTISPSLDMYNGIWLFVY